MADRVRIAVIGAGLIGSRHIAHIAASPEAALHAVVDPSPAGQELAERFRAPYFTDMSAMLAAGRPDGVLIATPNQLHVKHGLEAIAAGLPALIEKPIADDIAGGVRLVEAGEKAGVPILTGHHRRHNPMVQRAKAILDAGRLGRIVTVHSFFWILKPDAYFEAPWRRQPGAGPILLNFIHDIDLLRHFCGEVEAVQAITARDVRGFSVDETCVVLLRFASGALGTVNISDTVVAPWSWEQTTGENPAYPRTGEACYHIGGTHGSLAVPTLELWSNPGARGWFEPFETTRAVAADADPLVLQIAQFCRVIRGEEQPLVSGREGLANLRIVDAVQRSARDGVQVRVYG